MFICLAWTPTWAGLCWKIKNRDVKFNCPFTSVRPSQTSAVVFLFDQGFVFLVKKKSLEGVFTSSHMCGIPVMSASCSCYFTMVKTGMPCQDNSDRLKKRHRRFNTKLPCLTHCTPGLLWSSLAQLFKLYRSP